MGAKHAALGSFRCRAAADGVMQAPAAAGRRGMRPTGSGEATRLSSDGSASEG